jgi:hypothetical protein
LREPKVTWKARGGELALDFVSSISTWLGEHEAGISAVVEITVLAGVVFAGISEGTRWFRFNSMLRGGHFRNNAVHAGPLTIEAGVGLTGA